MSWGCALISVTAAALPIARKRGRASIGLSGRIWDFAAIPSLLAERQGWPTAVTLAFAQARLQNDRDWAVGRQAANLAPMKESGRRSDAKNLEGLRTAWQGMMQPFKGIL